MRPGRVAPAHIGRPFASEAMGSAAAGAVEPPFAGRVERVAQCGGEPGRVVAGDSGRAWWPLLLLVALSLVGSRCGWAWWRRHAWRRAAAQAVWLEIVPPV